MSRNPFLSSEAQGSTIAAGDVAMMVSQFKAGDSMADIAGEYGVTREDIEAAIRAALRTEAFKRSKA